MRFSFPVRFLGLCLALGLGRPADAMFTADLEDLGLSADQALDGSGGSGGFTSRGVHFGNAYNQEWQSWSGFAASTVSAPNTPGFANQFAAAAGTGAEGSATYAVGYDAGFPPDTDMVSLPSPAAVAGLFVNNTAYTALSMQHGDDFAKQFGGPDGTDPDFFALNISGRDGLGADLGSVDVYLADYRFPDPAQDFIVTDWVWVDLTPLGDSVSTLHFQLESSDVGQFGMNTPAYFAVDSLSVVPEPSSLVLALIGAGCLVHRRARRHFRGAGRG